MSPELIDIALLEHQPHATLSERITGKVRAVLLETIGEQEVRHEIMVPVWMDVREGMSDQDIELALLVKAADIVGRLKQHMGGPAPS